MEDTLTRRAFGVGAVAFIGAAFVGRLPKALAQPDAVATIPTWPDYQLEWLPHTFGVDPKFAVAGQKAVIATGLDENGKRWDAVFPYAADVDPHTPKAQAELRRLLSEAYVDLRHGELPEAQRKQGGSRERLRAQYGLPDTY